MYDVIGTVDKQSKRLACTASLTKAHEYAVRACHNWRHAGEASLEKDLPHARGRRTTNKVDPAEFTKAQWLLKYGDEVQGTIIIAEHIPKPKYVEHMGSRDICYFGDKRSRDLFVALSTARGAEVRPWENRIGGGPLKGSWVASVILKTTEENVPQSSNG